MENYHIEHRWFWAWQDEQEENWLAEMSARGFHLVKPGVFGRYEFQKGEPSQFVYRMDFLANSQQKKDYLQLFEDAGWEHLGEFGGWQYFRKPAGDDSAPEIFTDVRSKIQKYHRVLIFLAIVTPFYVAPLNYVNILAVNAQWLMWSLFAIWTILLVLYVFSVIKILLRIDQLKKTIRQ